MSGSPVPSGPAATTPLWCFDGFPYLVTRVVPAMYHVILLPEDLSREEAESVVRGQVEANRLETCLVLACDRALYVSPDGSAVPSGSIPGGGVIVADRLRPRRTFAVTCDLVARRQRLDSFLAARRRGGYMFGDLTGGARKATFEESVLLAGRQSNGVPRGLSCCPICRDWRGQCLQQRTEPASMLTTVHCRCDNDNRCAACGLRLYDRKLNANYYNVVDGRVWQVPGFSAFRHVCR
jgi:hypothetical protein